MKHLPENLKSILSILSDTEFHSGEELGQKLKITRSAIWKFVNQLEELGFIIETSKSKGYRLNQHYLPLNLKSIKNNCSKSTLNKLSYFFIEDIVDSTNNYLQKNSYHNYSVCVAEQQTAGKGRLGRNWHSPFGSNIYLSCLWKVQADISELGGLSIIVGLATLKAIQQIGVDELRIKWPNDIMWQNKKFVGILIEISAEMNGFSKAIIGIGINVNCAPKLFNTTCIKNVINSYIDRNILIGYTLNSLFDYLEIYSKFGLNHFLDEWNLYDFLNNKNIRISQFDKTDQGIACGINSLGHLLVKTEKGNIKSFSAGDSTIEK